MRFRLFCGGCEIPLNLQKEINFLRPIPKIGAYLVRALTRLEETVNQIGENTNSDPTGTLPPPPPLAGVNVANAGDNLVHVTLTDNNTLKKNTRYWVEVGTDPSFANAYPEDLGASRHRILSLPQGTYYVRAFHQYPGGTPSTPVIYGGMTPTAVTISTGSALTLLPSTGSGTAAPDGSQPGQGLGVFLSRPAPGPKRRITG
jgi:hypothetical protein